MGPSLVQKRPDQVRNVILLRSFSCLNVVSVQQLGLGMVDLATQRARLHFTVQKNVQILRLSRVGVNKLVLNVLHAVVLSVQIEWIRLAVLFQLFLLFFLASFGFNDAIPVDEAFAGPCSRKIGQAFLFRLLLLLFALDSTLALLLSLNQPAQVV